MKIGFIGTGNMGSGMIKGIINAQFVPNRNINIFDLDQTKTQILAQEFGITVLNSETEIAEKSDIIILAVKPNIYPIILEKIKDSLNHQHIILTIAAGFPIEKTEKIIGNDKKIVRTMPNTPAQVLEGMTAVAFNPNITDNEKITIFNLLNSFGKSIEIEEHLMNAYTAISGSLPAYVFMFAEALADGGVLQGMPREKTYHIVSQAILGSAKMLLETQKHPAVLKDEVCSPNGTTIEAVRILEKGNFRATIIDAVKICTEKAKQMEK